MTQKFYEADYIGGGFLSDEQTVRALSDQVRVLSDENARLKENVASSKQLFDIATSKSAEKDTQIKDLHQQLSSLKASMGEDKNFGVRLKASIDKRMKEAGMWDRLLKQSKHWDDYKEMERKFFDSMDDITLNYLQGSKPSIISKGEEWISVDDKPLTEDMGNGRWICTDSGDNEFIAAVPYFDDKQPGKKLWWIKHCVISNSNLCVVTNDDVEESGWEIDSVTHYMPLPLPPSNKEVK